MQVKIFWTVGVEIHSFFTFMFVDYLVDVIFILIFMVCEVPVYKNEVKSDARINLKIILADC